MNNSNKANWTKEDRILMLQVDTHALAKKIKLAESLNTENRARL